MELRDWQQEAYLKLQEKNFNGVVKVASGKGKTVLGLYILQEILRKEPEKKILVVVPTINLMVQWQKECTKFFPDITCSFYYGGKKDESGQVVITVINTASKLPFEGKYSLKILDEVHHYGASLYQSIFSLATNHTIGLSATPHRRDEGNTAIKYGAGKVVYELSHIDELQKVFSLWHIACSFTYDEYQEYTDLQKEISQIIGLLTSQYGYVDLEQAKRRGRQGNRAALKLLKLWSKVAQLKYRAEQKYEIAQELIQMEEHEKIIVFSESIYFTEELGKRVPSALVVHSKLSKTEVLNRLAEFRKMKSGVLIAPKIIDEGYDVPDASVAIITSFTGTARQMIQRDGRILRLEGKDYARRYTVVLEGIEDQKYFRLLKETKMQDIARDGQWLKYDNGGFISHPEFQTSFEVYLSEEKNTGFYGWVKKKMRYFLDSKKDLVGRVEFFDQYRDVILEIAQENPDDFPELQVEAVERENYYFELEMNDEKKEMLKGQLRSINARLQLPSDFFNGVMRFLDSEKFEMSKDSKEFLIELTNDEEAGIWPPELFSFLKKTFRKYVVDIQ